MSAIRKAPGATVPGPFQKSNATTQNDKVSVALVGGKNTERPRAEAFTDLADRSAADEFSAWALAGVLAAVA